MGSLDRRSNEIFEILSDKANINLTVQIRAGLYAEKGAKTLPTLLLYNGAGLQLFEKITYLDEYYLTGAEIDVLNQHADRVAERIPDNAMVLELGSGNLRKIRILLDALDRTGKHISYYALDIMRSELERSLLAVPEGTFQNIKCAGLHGSYDDGIDWLKRPEHVGRPKAILSLGSSIGNFPPDEAAAFIGSFARDLGEHDMILVGLDWCTDPERVYRAYNDRDGVTRRFTLNGLDHANALLGHEAFQLDNWEAVGEYDAAGARHRAFVTPKCDVAVEGVRVEKGEWVRIEESYKFTQSRVDKIWGHANRSPQEEDVNGVSHEVVESAVWSNDKGDYKLHLLRPTTRFETQPEEYAASPVPSLTEWDELWQLWDLVTRQMMTNILERPINLRNAGIFYLGHIPTFLDMKLSEATKTPLIEPKYFSQIFERGIDPDVDNPELCHAHSEVPADWPQVKTILRYQQDVRRRVHALYESGRIANDPWAGRSMWLGFEHEAMHLETLLYMLIQSKTTVPPPGVSKPDFERLAQQSAENAVENEWFRIPGQKFSIGLDDPETATGPPRYHGWDIEKPKREVTVPSFLAKARPITVHEYAEYLRASGQRVIPASWVDLAVSRAEHATQQGSTNGYVDWQGFLRGKAVRTVYGPVSLNHALDWPVCASYDELIGCAKYMGGRIPTMEEARSIYLYGDSIRRRETDKCRSEKIPAVNSHLLNEGVEETPPSKASCNGAAPARADARPDPKALFANLSHANVGFQHWHPTPVTQNGGQLAGLSEMGGLWEWTSSVLEKADGFEPMPLYPAYSADFFDGKHNIVLGGSWATHPRIAGRKTFVNWYQRNYPYVWAGARLVKDV